MVCGPLAIALTVFATVSFVAVGIGCLLSLAVLARILWTTRHHPHDHGGTDD